MRQICKLKNMITGDLMFQWKYGFYLLYIVISVFYIWVLSFLKGSIKETAGIILILTDPATMGMFFMGAIVLLEKSQRVLNSIAISPIRPTTYIFSKVISLGIISTITGVVIGIAKGGGNLVLTAIGVFAGSVVFSLCGLIVGANIKSLNQYVIATIPFEIIGFVPIVMELAGVKSVFVTIQPTVIVMRLIQGRMEHMGILLVVLMVWIAALFLLAGHFVKHMYQRVGGVVL